MGHIQWIQHQFAKVDMNDTRLEKRAVEIAQGCAEHPEKSLSGRFADWAGLQAAYRFFRNPKVTHQALQQPHYQEVLKKAFWAEGLVLFIQDGSELLFNSHPWTHGLGPTADAAGNGLMFHSCLVAKYHESKETEILGLSYQEAWVRPEKKSVNSSKESEVWLRTLKKSGRPQKNWVSVGDRANDIFDFLHGANSDGWNFVVRARHDRKVEMNGSQKRLFPWIRQQAAKCKDTLFVKAKGKEFSGEVELGITWAKAKLLPPGQTRSTVTEDVTYVRVWCPERPKLEWLLITNLPVENEEDVRKIVEIYRRRWLIEDYHKAVKTGYRIEDSQLKQASRILALFGIVGVIATQLLAMREHCRLCPTTRVEEAIPRLWIMLIKQRFFREKIETVRDFWRCLARLGGFIGRKSDGEPGWQTIWGGYTRLQDMLWGAMNTTCV
jgi:hypothetical protein